MHRAESRETVHRRDSWAVVDGCWFSDCLNDHLWTTIRAYCCSLCKKHPWYPSNIPQITGQGMFMWYSQPEESHRDVQHRDFHQSLIFHSGIWKDLKICIQMTFCAPWKLWHAGAIWNISQVQGTELSLFKQRRKVLGESTDNTDPKGEPTGRNKTSYSKDI